MKRREGKSRSGYRHMITCMLAFAVALFMWPYASDAYTVRDMNIGSGDIKCTDTGVLYRIRGNSDRNTIVVDGGSSSDPVLVDLAGVDLDLHRADDGDSIDASPLTVKKGSHAVIYAGKDDASAVNSLYGGNESGAGKNWGYAGLCIEDGAAVTISGKGTLRAHGGGVQYGGAGIGSNYDEDARNIRIEGDVTIEAEGGHSGAGIGSGRDGEVFGITIADGDVTARGGRYAAGIGAGDAAGGGDGGRAHGIDISGGTIDARGGEYGAGIGGSEDGDCYGISVTGGDITARGGSEAAAIGGGYEGYTDRITITGGKISAEGGSLGAAIGGGEGGDCSSISISGGTIEAFGGDEGAAVGSSREGYTGSISVTGGDITARGGSQGAGIGGANSISAGNGGDAGTISISGASVDAYGGHKGAGIGGGDGGDFGSISIEGSSVHAEGGTEGAGIGSACHSAGNISIVLDGETITARGGRAAAGIGGGNGDGGDISIRGTGTIDAAGIEGAGIGGGMYSSSGNITIEGKTGARDLHIKAEAKNGEFNNAAAAIGGGSASSGDIKVSDAKVDAVAGHLGAGIGTGDRRTATRQYVDRIDLDNCGINVSGPVEGAGIGAGHGGSVKVIDMRDCSYEGPSIGTSSDPDAITKPNSMESIRIEGSTVKATADHAPGKCRAGIGTGPSGDIDEIVIISSDIKASGVHGGAGVGSGGTPSTDSLLSYGNGNVGTLTITDSTVEANAVSGAAAVGGGIYGNAGNIKIKDSDVRASSDPGSAYPDAGGAGIGAGYAASAENISIEGGSIYARGGNYAAGIGSGGAKTAVVTFRDVHTGKIDIRGGADVTARGGSGGAGIGSGCGAQIDRGITIMDSDVDAEGAYHGSGIGAGSNGAAGRGGECNDLFIGGKSVVRAQGGEGAAGVGGGFEGGGDGIEIDIETTPDRKYSLTAMGGQGAAGIGSGGVTENEDREHLTKTGYNVSNVAVRGGYIIARGGSSYSRYGSGAGIGGGARKGCLHGLEITGGYIDAVSGGPDSRDIGNGGDGGVPRLADDRNFLVTGGTILSSRWSRDTDPVITGGSVRADIDHAEDGEGDPVYRTTMQLIDEADYLMEDVRTSVPHYGTRDIFTDGNKRIYLYMPEKGHMASTADVKVRGDERHYYGTTTADGDGVMKMGGKIHFLEPEEEILAGNTFVMKPDDGDFAGTSFTFEAEGCASIKSVTRDTAPGAEVLMKADDFGTFTLKASGGSENDPVYWNAQGSYEGKVTRGLGTIEITGYPGKIYDGEAVTDPEVSRVGDGEVSYTYRDASGNVLAGPPRDAGRYIVTAGMKETERYSGAVSEPLEFTIEKKEIFLSLSASESGERADVNCSAAGLLEENGGIRFEVTGEGMDPSVRDVLIEKKGSSYSSSASFDGAAAGTYTVKASYIPGSPENYVCREADEKSFEKDLAARDISVAQPPVKTYGDGDFNLGASTGKPLDTDVWTCEIEDDRAFPAEKAVSVSGDTVSIENAGTAVIRITLRDGSERPVYRDQETFVTVRVKKAPLHVRSYASDDEAVYGSIEDLSYGLEYRTEDFVKGDDEDDFTKGHGTLEAVPLIKTACVSDTPYGIGISRRGTDITRDGKTYRNVFISRNYDIQYECGKVAVTPAPLTVNASDTRGSAGTEPEYGYSIGGEAAWDDEDSIFLTVPEAFLDEEKAGGSYGELMPGMYEDCIDVKAGTQKENRAGTLNYRISCERGTLTIDRARPHIIIDAESKTYDGKPAKVDIRVEAAVPYEGSPDKEYFRYEGGRYISCAEDPEGAGRYMVKASVPESDIFAAAEEEAFFTIRKAASDPELPEPDDMVMRDGLVLGDQVLPHGWQWQDSDTSLEPGHVSGTAVFTPEDDENYRTAKREISFRVLPSLEAEGEASVHEGVIRAETQKDADVYWIMDDGSGMGADDIKAGGNVMKAVDGRAVIEITGLEADREYTFLLAAELNGCTSGIETVTFMTGREDIPPAPGGDEGEGGEGPGGVRTGDDRDMISLMIMMMTALTLAGIAAAGGMPAGRRGR